MRISRSTGFVVLSLGLLAAATFGAAHADAPARPRPLQMAPEDLVKDPLVWRAFRPLVVAFGEGDSARTVDFLERASAITRKVDGNLQLDETTDRIRTEAHDRLKDFDMEEYYELLPQRAAGFHRFGFMGHVEPKAYVVTEMTKESDEVGVEGKRRELGDSSGVILAKRIEGDDDHYLLQWRGGVGLETLSWPSALSGISDAIKLLGEGYESDKPLVLAAADAYMKKAQPSLDAEDRRVLALAWSSYPSIADHLIKISHTSDVLAPAPIDGCTKLQSVARWVPERIGRRYPELGEFLENMGDLAEIDVRLDDGNGHRLATLHLSSEKQQSRLTAFVKDGALVPSRNDKPLADKKARYDRMTVHVDMHFVLHGMDLFIDDYRMRLTYKETPDGMRLTGSATEVPKVRIKGAAFGILPTRVVDFFIPGDVSGLATRYFDVLAKGNEGRGLAFVVRWSQDAQGRTTLDGNAGAEVLDNDLVRFAISFASKRTIPNEKVEDEMHAMALDYRDAFDADLARFKKYGTPVVAEQWRAFVQGGMAESPAPAPGVDEAAGEPEVQAVP